MTHYLVQTQEHNVFLLFFDKVTYTFTGLVSWQNQEVRLTDKDKNCIYRLVIEKV